MKQLDVRAIPPRDRHHTIFKLFDHLATGESFELINDHSPKPLHYQFMHERTDHFTWQDLETGPEIWRVQITRIEPEHE